MTALVGAAFWHHQQEALAALRRTVVTDELRPMATLLNESRMLIQELQSEPLESYLANIRRDGVAQHADMKQRLDTLLENNTATVTLIKVYAAHAKTPEYVAASDNFRNYASAWRDRWNSVMELFMSGGNYAASEVAWPKEFQQAVQTELAATE